MRTMSVNWAFCGKRWGSGNDLMTTVANREEHTHNLDNQAARMVVLIWITYAFYYLGRLNLSPALDALASDLNISRTAAGSLGSVMFWCYAIGHLINGQLGSRISPHRLVAGGLLVIAVTNLLFSTQTNLLVLAILWGINGFAQSTGWAPLLRILSERLNQSQRRRISTIFPMSYLVGSAATWGLSGWLVATVGWRAAFWVPGIVLLGMLVVWWIAGTDAPTAQANANDASHWRLAVADVRQLLPLLAIAGLVGFVHVGGSIWIPTYVLDTDLFSDRISGLIAGIIPLTGIIGMVIAGRRLRNGSDLFATMRMLIAGSFFTLILALFLPQLMQLIAVGVMMLLLSGVTALILSSVPMLLAAEGRAASVGGTVTAITNVGGGLAGIIIGSVVEQWSWTYAFGLWSICLGVVLLMLLAMGRQS